jgi:hypothetical protein
MVEMVSPVRPAAGRRGLCAPQQNVIELASNRVCASPSTTSLIRPVESTNVFGTVATVRRDLRVRCPENRSRFVRLRRSGGVARRRAGAGLTSTAGFVVRVAGCGAGVASVSSGSSSSQGARQRRPSPASRISPLMVRKMAAASGLANRVRKVCSRARPVMPTGMAQPASHAGAFQIRVIVRRVTRLVTMVTIGGWVAMGALLASGCC